MTKLLEVKNLTTVLIKESQLLHQNINFSIKKGHNLAILGLSGSGKSTLAALLAGYPLHNIQISSGMINFSSQNQKAFLPQQAQRYLNPAFTLQSHFDLLVQDKKLHKEEKKSKISHLLAMLDLDPLFLPFYPNEISGGMALRFSLALTLINEPDLLILDEPTVSLDNYLAEQIMQLLKDFQKRGLTILFISHDLKRAASIADEFIFLDRGRITDHKSFQEFFAGASDCSVAAQEMLYAYNILEKGEKT